MATLKAKNKTELFLKIMADGKERTIQQIAQRTGLKNVRSTVDRLRNYGYSIETNKHETKNGVVYKYQFN